jgi:hypothetical protein
VITVRDCFLEIFSDRVFESRQGLGIFLFIPASRPDLVPIQPPIQWVTGPLSLGVKRQGMNPTTHLHLVPRLKNTWGYTSTPQYAFMAWCSVTVTGTTLPLPFYRTYLETASSIHTLRTREAVVTRNPLNMGLRYRGEDSIKINLRDVG